MTLNFLRSSDVLTSYSTYYYNITLLYVCAQDPYLLLLDAESSVSYYNSYRMSLFLKEIVSVCRVLLYPFLYLKLSAMCISYNLVSLSFCGSCLHAFYLKLCTILDQL